VSCIPSGAAHNDHRATDSRQLSLITDGILHDRPLSSRAFSGSLKRPFVQIRIIY
jgi:hypothetical protein